MSRSPAYALRCTRFSILLVALVCAFFTLLISLPLLRRPVSPSRKQHLGWQAWDVVRYQKSLRGGLAGEEASGGGDTGVEDGGGAGSLSLPLDKWDPLLPHSTGITEVTVKACYFPPWISPALCAPETTPQDDKAKGKWVRVDRDLNMRTGIWYLNVYYRRTRRFDVPLIDSLLLLEDGSAPPAGIDLSQYQQAHGDFRSGVWPKQRAMRMWYRTKQPEQLGVTRTGWRRKREPAGLQSSGRDDWDEEFDDPTIPTYTVGSDQSDFITELDVLYGDDRPFFGFERVLNGPIVRASDRWDSVNIVVRRGNPIPAYVEPPRFSKDGKLKILQVADMHFAVNNGSCRDTNKSPCSADPDSIQLMAEALDAERPDLVVFSGDQLNGAGSADESYDSKSVIAKVFGPVIDRKIPWVAIFGNHDSELVDDRAYQMKLLQSMPYSLAEPGPSNVDGVGNYLIKLYSADASRMHIFSLYLLDSHARQKPQFPWQEGDYDFLKPSQIDWFLETSNAIKPIERPFTPDGADDLGHIWRRDAAKRRLSARQNTQLAKPNAMMFFHIPLEQSYGPVDVDHLTGEPLDVGTQVDGEEDGASKTESYFFEKGLKKAMEMTPEVVAGQDWAVNLFEVKVVGHGHCHNIDKCRRVSGIWMCFGGGGSYGGYGNVNFARRHRIYTISDYGETIDTYKRLEDGTIIEEQRLVGPGAPMHGAQEQMTEDEGMQEL